MHKKNTKNKCTCASQDQSSGAGAAGGRLLGERRP